MCILDPRKDFPHKQPSWPLNRFSKYENTKVMELAQIDKGLLCDSAMITPTSTYSMLDSSYTCHFMCHFVGLCFRGPYFVLPDRLYLSLYVSFCVASIILCNGIIIT
jgi:hypothetical protein